eukprot:3912917-Prymnesium_polylepis.1
MRPDAFIIDASTSIALVQQPTHEYMGRKGCQRQEGCSTAALNPSQPHPTRTWAERAASDKRDAAPRSMIDFGMQHRDRSNDGGGERPRSQSQRRSRAAVRVAAGV